MQITVKADIKRATKKLNAIQRKQIPYATSLALNDTAFQAREDLQKAMPKHLHNPTPWTIRGVRVNKAAKRKLRAEVYFLANRATYMRYQVKGGVRNPTGRAILMPKSIKLNKYGNMPRNAVARALAQPETFSGTIKGVGGIWQRGHYSKRGNWSTKGKGRSSSIKLLVRYEDRATYRPRLPMLSIVRSTVNRRFRTHLNRRLALALRTAK